MKEFPGPIRPVIEFCLQHDINIMQMPCPETLTPSGGLGRVPRGKAWYESQGLRQTAREIAVGQANYMKQIMSRGFEVLAIIGVEFSPACAVNYLNKGRALVKAKGIFIEELELAMAERAISIPFIGVSQRWKKKMLADLGRTLAAAT